MTDWTEREDAPPMKRHHWILIAVAALAAILFLAASRTASAADADRGRRLYESHCLACHGQSVHGREKRAATDFGAVRDWVSRWNRSLALGWSAAEIDDVAVHLNITYYGYRCPPEVCKVVSRPSEEGKPPGARERAPG